MDIEMKLRKRQMLESLDYIDDDLISSTLKKIKPDFAAAESEKMTWRTPLKYWRQFVALAACLVLLSCAIPLISYILPSIGRIFTGNAGAGSDEVTYPEHYYDMSDRDLIEHIGEVPDEFVDIVSKNLFADVVTSGDKIIKKAAAPYDVEVYDRSGKLLYRIEIKGDVPEFMPNRHRIHSLEDGTYLLVIPCTKGYIISSDDSVNDNARVIRFNKKGKVLFDTKIGVNKEFCIFDFFHETEDAYILISGSYQRRDSCFIKIDKSGNILKNIHIGGLDSDRLYWVYFSDSGFTAYMREHTLITNAGDTQKVEFDYDFNVLSNNSVKEVPYPIIYQRPSITSGPISWDVRGFVLGYDPEMKGDEIPATGGRVTAVIEYDDFILIISEHDTKHYYANPLMSTPFSYTETVYTAHALDGTILWRTAVDSTEYAALYELDKRNEQYMGDWLN